MDKKYVYKEAFTVIGKLGYGPAENASEWIMPIWNEANTNFDEISSLVKKKDNAVEAVWGIMSDMGESFQRWDEQGGKYLACCETDTTVNPPEGWTKWTVPSQTYVVADCTSNEYLKVFDYIIKEYLPANNVELIGAVHERYPEPGNPNLVELYFPIAKGQYFCQSCGMPMKSTEDRGTEKDKSISEDYCCYCYQDGKFSSDMKMEDMIEFCIPFEIEAGIYPDAQSARTEMLSYFPQLKRWKTTE